MQPWQQRAWMSLFSPIWRALILTRQTLKRSWKEHRSIRRDRIQMTSYHSLWVKTGQAAKNGWLPLIGHCDSSSIEIEMMDHSLNWQATGLILGTTVLPRNHFQSAMKQPPNHLSQTGEPVVPSKHLINDIIPLQHLGTFSPFPCCFNQSKGCHCHLLPWLYDLLLSLVLPMNQPLSS